MEALNSARTPPIVTWVESYQLVMVTVMEYCLNSVHHFSVSQNWQHLLTVSVDNRSLEDDHEAAAVGLVMMALWNDLRQKTSSRPFFRSLVRCVLSPLLCNMSHTRTQSSHTNSTTSTPILCHISTYAVDDVPTRQLIKQVLLAHKIKQKR